MNSHIKSIIPQVGGMAPIDKDTWAFFDYENNAMDRMQNLNPIGERVGRYFEGDGYYEVAHSETLNATNGVTISFWLKHSATGGWSPFIGKDDGTTNGCNYRIWIGTGDRVIDFIGAGRNYASLDVSSLLSYDKWQHILISHDGSKARYYINGIWAGSINHQIGGTNDAPLRIGRDNTETYGTGGLSNVRVFNRALSESEIEQEANNIITKNSSLIGYWKLNEDDETVAHDYSGNGNDGISNHIIKKMTGPASYSILKENHYKAVVNPNDSGIVIEDGTTNLIQEPLNPDTWLISNDPDYGYVSHEVIETEFGVKGLRRVLERKETTDYRGVLTRMFCDLPNVTTSSNFSIYVRVLEGVDCTATINFQGVDVNGGRVDVSQSFPFNSRNWQRIDLTAILADSNFEKLEGYMKVYPYPQSGLGNRATIDMVYPQLEEQSYVTEFTEETREDGSLDYPIDISGDNCTISFWAKCKANRGFYLDMFPKVGGDNDRIFIRPEENLTQIGFGKIVNDSPQYLVNQPMEDATSWRMYTLVCEELKTTLYQDDKKVAEKSCTAIGSMKKLSFSRGPSTYESSAVLKNLRIDKIARSEDEVRAWYYQGRNRW